MPSKLPYLERAMKWSLVSADKVAVYFLNTSDRQGALSALHHWGELEMEQLPLEGCRTNLDFKKISKSGPNSGEASIGIAGDHNIVGLVRYAAGREKDTILKELARIKVPGAQQALEARIAREAADATYVPPIFKAEVMPSAPETPAACSSAKPADAAVAASAAPSEGVDSQRGLFDADAPHYNHTSEPSPQKAETKPFQRGLFDADAPRYEHTAERRPEGSIRKVPQGFSERLKAKRAGELFPELPIPADSGATGHKPPTRRR